MSQGDAPGPVPMSQRSFGERLLGAVKLDASVYEEVEHDANALGQAAGVVALAAVAEGIGGLTEGGVGALVGGIVSGFLGWAVATAVVWGIGVKALGHTSDYPELLRTLGFASAPKLLLVLGLILGPLRGLLWLVVAVLTLIAFVIAVRQALDVTTGRAVGVCALAVVAMVVLAMVFGGLAAL